MRLLGKDEILTLRTGRAIGKEFDQDIDIIADFGLRNADWKPATAKSEIQIQK